MSGGRSKKVSVWARIRPTPDFAHDNLDLQKDSKTVSVHMGRDPKRGVVNNQILDWSFKLDGIFHNATQDQIYETLGTDIVTEAIKGYNGTLMCYGQTGAGKTYTMAGATENFCNRGLIPRALAQLYREVKGRDEYATTVRISYLEIYNETMYDLLSTLPEAWSRMSPDPMTVVENESGVYVKGLSCHLAQTEEEALNLLFEGETNRVISAHTLNKQSSRSHCIFTVYIESRSRTISRAKYTVSKLNFVDLAGSERLGKTMSAGKTQMEAMYINKSLTFLEQVVIALADKRRDHVPFRQSKLTHCLKDSIGGTSNTILVANVWGESAQMEETVSTLRFATRMMCVDSTPTVNEVFDPVIMVKQLEKEVIHLKAELAMHDTLTNRSQVMYDVLSEQQRFEIKQQVTKYIDGSLDEIDITNIRQILGVFECFKDIHSTLEQQLEEKLREKYTLIDRTDPEAILSAQKAGFPIDDDGKLVGETDGSGFGVGQAPKSARKDVGSVASAKRRARDKFASKSRASPVGGGKPSASPIPSGDKRADRGKSPTPVPTEKKDEPVEERVITPVSTARISATKLHEKPQRPSTPPPRAAAFEDFKNEKGVEINRILQENKEIHSQKKKAYADLAHTINQCKLEIDDCRERLESYKHDREEDGLTHNEDGEVVISEKEFLEIKKLKELKKQYRIDFEKLQEIKSEVSYCQRLVEQCRQRLVQEFDQWYAESFLLADLSSIIDPTVAPKAGVAVPSDSQGEFEDDLDKFHRLQSELLMTKPESAAFYGAQITTQRRKAYQINMLQPQNRSNSPRTPPSTIRNRPPNMLQVSN